MTSGAEQQSDAQERPGDQREVARRPDPARVELAADQGPDAEGEGIDQST